MKRSSLLLAVSLCTTAAACKSGEPEPASATTQSATAPAASAAPSTTTTTNPARALAAAKAREEAWAPPPSVPAEVTGPLTVERVAAARSLLPAPKLAPKVMPILLAQLGKPTRTTTGTHPMLGKEQKRYAWAAKSGTTCAVYAVVEQPNTLDGWPPALAEDTGTGTFEKAKSGGDPAGWVACMAMLGDKPPTDKADTR